MTKTATKPRTKPAGVKTGRMVNPTPNVEEREAPARPAIPARFLVETPEAASLLDCAKRLEAEAKSLASTLRTREGMGSVAVARTYVTLHFLAQCIDLATKEYTGLYERFKREVVPAAFEADGVTHVPLAEGYRVGVSAPLRCSIREGMRERAYEWLRQNGLESLITETVNSSTLAATAKTLLEDEGRDLPETMFNVALVPGASVTKTKK